MIMIDMVFIAYYHDKIIFNYFILTHKAVNNTAPEYLCDLIRFNETMSYRYLQIDL